MSTARAKILARVLLPGGLSLGSLQNHELTPEFRPPGILRPVTLLPLYINLLYPHG
jgi:hypothetical protein